MLLVSWRSTERAHCSMYGGGKIKLVGGGQSKKTPAPAPDPSPRRGRASGGRIGRNDDAAGDRRRAVEIGDIQAGIVITRLELPPHAGIQRQTRRNAERVLHERLVVYRAAIVIRNHHRHLRAAGNSEKKIA